MNASVEKLQREFERRKKKNSQFSLRSFAKWLDVSPAQLSQILSEKRGLTSKTAAKIAGKLSLSPREKVKFITPTHSELSEAIENLHHSEMRLRLEEDQFHLIAEWYHFAILSLTKTKGAKSDPRWVARRLGISVRDASEALLRLERLGMLEIRPRFRQISDPIAVAPAVASAAVKKYHAQNLSLAAEKLETTELHLRNFQSITFAADPVRISEFETLLDRFLTEASELLEDGTPSEVYTLAIQLFPATK